MIDPFVGLGDLDAAACCAPPPRRASRAIPLRVLRLPRLLLRLPGFAADPETLLPRPPRRAAPRRGRRRAGARRVGDPLRPSGGPPRARPAGGARPLSRPLAGRAGRAGQAGGGDRRARGAAGAAPRAARDRRRRRGRRRRPRRPLRRDLRAPAGSRRPLPSTLAAFRDAGYLTRQEAAKVALLLSWEELPESGLGRRRFLHRAGPLWATALCLAGGARRRPTPLSSAGAPLLRPLVELARREGAALFDPPRLLTGGEVAELLGVPRDRRSGRRWPPVRQAQVDGRVRTREEALALLTFTSFEHP